MLVDRDNRIRYCYTGTHKHWDTQTEGHIEPGTDTHTGIHTTRTESWGTEAEAHQNKA